VAISSFRQVIYIYFYIISCLDINLYFMTQIFSYEVFRGVLGFANWWMQFLSFATIGCGLAYQSYFDQA